MTRDSTKVRAGANGLAYVAPTGTAAPTDSTTALNAAFLDLGWIESSGIVESNKRSTADVRGINGALVRRLVTTSEHTFKVKFLESKGSVVDLYYSKPTLAVVTGKTTVSIGAPGPDNRSFVFDIIDGTKHRRLYCPVAEVSDVDDITYANSGAIQYGVTITAYLDATGFSTYEFTDEDWTIA